MKIRRFILSIISLLFLFSACTTDYNQLIKESESEFYSGKYKEAARKLLPVINDESNNQLLFMMECGMMLHAAGDYKTSNKVLLQAAKLSEKIATSVTKQTAALLLNETKTNYKGEDFERGS